MQHFSSGMGHAWIEFPTWKQKEYFAGAMVFSLQVVGLIGATVNLIMPVVEWTASKYIDHIAPHGTTTHAAINIQLCVKNVSSKPEKSDSVGTQ